MLRYLAELVRKCDTLEDTEGKEIFTLSYMLKGPANEQLKKCEVLPKRTKMGHMMDIDRENPIERTCHVGCDYRGYNQISRRTRVKKRMEASMIEGYTKQRKSSVTYNMPTRRPKCTWKV